MDNGSLINWSVLFGGIGAGYFMYERSKRQLLHYLWGSHFSYFPSLAMLLIVGGGGGGLVLVVTAYFIKI